MSAKAGFTLVETLVAFAITALALAGLIPLIAASLTRTESAATMRLAALYAESKLAQLGTEIALRPGELAGQLDERFRWSARVSVMPELLREPSLGVRVYDIAVSVMWGDPSSPRSVTLQTLRIGPAQP